MSVPLSTIVEFLDHELDIDTIDDASLNGLQVQACDAVERVALAVDAAAATIDAAVAEHCQLLLVHHGLFWGQQAALRDALGARVGACFRGGLSVYAAHLPLDAHPQLGNNALLARRLGALPDGGFGDVGGSSSGVLASLPEPASLAEIAGALAAAGCDDQIMWSFGPDPLRRVAVVTGSGCSLLSEAIAAGADCFITGEPRHGAYHEAREAGINCLFAGHYATEVFGLRAVGERLNEHLGLQTCWIEHPTGI